MTLIKVKIEDNLQLTVEVVEIFIINGVMQVTKVITGLSGANTSDRFRLAMSGGAALLQQTQDCKCS